MKVLLFLFLLEPALAAELRVLSSMPTLMSFSSLPRHFDFQGNVVFVFVDIHRGRERWRGKYLRS
jgi:hypothetical protein